MRQVSDLQERQPAREHERVLRRLQDRGQGYQSVSHHREP